MSDEAESTSAPAGEGRPAETQTETEGDGEPGTPSATAGPTDATSAADDGADTTSDGGLDLDAVVRGALGFLVAVTYTVVAAVASLVPPVSLAGATLNVAVWTGLIVVGLVAAAWVGFDVGRGDLSVRRLATFVGTAWVLLLPLGAVVEGVVAPLLGAGLVTIYLGRILVFAVATAGALWMAYGGGWDRARARMGSGGLEKM
jgi:hypothetical protein